MATWDELKVALLRLREAIPGALTGYPDPGRNEDRVPPYRISLAPWATDVAKEIHDHFGADVELQVGALSYPQRGLLFLAEQAELFERMNPDEMEVRLNGPLVVRSGHTVNHSIEVDNRSRNELQIMTNGGLTAVVVDLEGNKVGGFAGPQRQPLVMFEVGPGSSARIPLLVGTAGMVPGLGYSVPAGEWSLETVLRLQDGRQLCTPPLRFTVTD